MNLFNLFRTTNSCALTVLRITLGVIFLAHGLQKTFGLFGGGGFNGTMAYFESQHVPAVFAFLAIMAEFLGGIGLILGLLTRVAAFGIACNMLVAIATVHWKIGFFMNWSGQQKGEGIEFGLLILASSICLMIAGAGCLSVDGLISKRPN